MHDFDVLDFLPGQVLRTSSLFSMFSPAAEKVLGFAGIWSERERRRLTGAVREAFWENAERREEEEGSGGREEEKAAVRAVEDDDNCRRYMKTARFL